MMNGRERWTLKSANLYYEYFVGIPDNKVETNELSL